MATGSTDHMIRVYYLGAEAPMKVAEMDAHTVRRIGMQLLYLLQPREAKTINANHIKYSGEV